MPSFDVSQKNLDRLAKKSVSETDLEAAKAELEAGGSGTLRLKAGDTNRPDLWSEEGIARVVRGLHGAGGVPRLVAKKGTKKIIVGRGVMQIRP